MRSKAYMSICRELLIVNWCPAQRQSEAKMETRIGEINGLGDGGGECP